MQNAALRPSKRLTRRCQTFATGTECLPVGEEIPRADPWVHFGDGSKIYETLLPAGQYTLTLQIGDDEHRTQEGLCTTISITVE